MSHLEIVGNSFSTDYGIIISAKKSKNHLQRINISNNKFNCASNEIDVPSNVEINSNDVTTFLTNETTSFNGGDIFLGKYALDNKDDYRVNAYFPIIYRNNLYLKNNNSSTPYIDITIKEIKTGIANLIQGGNIMARVNISEKDTINSVILKIMKSYLGNNVLQRIGTNTLRIRSKTYHSSKLEDINSDSESLVVTTKNVDGVRTLLTKGDGYANVSRIVDNLSDIDKNEIVDISNYIPQEGLPIWIKSINRYVYYGGYINNKGTIFFMGDGYNATYSRYGETKSRPSPTKTDINFLYFDTTLNKPIWWTGSKWVDATGAEV